MLQFKILEDGLYINLLVQALAPILVTSAKFMTSSFYILTFLTSHVIYLIFFPRNTLKNYLDIIITNRIVDFSICIVFLDPI